jgi:hypothetical protein
MSKADPTPDELAARTDRIQSLSGLSAVEAGDIVIAIAAILGIIYVSRDIRNIIGLGPNRRHTERWLYGYWHYDHCLLWY